mgnify:CR=1 FL=1
MNGNKDCRVLAKIISHIDHTLEYCAGYDFDSFMENRMLQEACIFNVLQIGELSKIGLSSAFTSQYPQIPWKQMYGMRNRLVHDYEGIRLKIIWSTISEDFPMLRDQLQEILAQIQEVFAAHRLLDARLYYVQAALS